MVEHAAAVLPDPIISLAGLWERIATTALPPGCAMAGTIVFGGNVAKHIRVTLEIGPKGKKVVAVAPDWPGLERGAKTEEEAIERLRSYVPRYSQVAKLAEMDAEFDAITNVDVV